MRFNTHISTNNIYYPPDKQSMVKWWVQIILVVTIVLSILIIGCVLPSSQIFGEVTYQINTDDKILYLTFDDGPSENTEKILDILKEKDVKATFFVLGIRAEENRATLLRIQDGGHSIGVHSMTHALLYKNCTEEIKISKNIVEAIIGEPIFLFRPPYGFRTPWTISAAKELGLEVVTWNVFPEDYKKNSKSIVSSIINNIKPGAIMVLHDGPGNREETIKSLPIIIDKAREKGYSFDVLEN